MIWAGARTTLWTRETKSFSTLTEMAVVTIITNQPRATVRAISTNLTATRALFFNEVLVYFMPDVLFYPRFFFHVVVKVSFKFWSTKNSRCYMLSINRSCTEGEKKRWVYDRKVVHAVQELGVQSRYCKNVMHIPVSLQYCGHVFVDNVR